MFKKIIIAVFLIGFMATGAYALTERLLTDVTATGASTKTTSGRSAHQWVTMIFNGNPTAIVLDVEYSPDGGDTWHQLQRKTLTSAELSDGITGFTIVNQPRNLIRHNLITFTNGSSITTWHRTLR